MADHGNDSNENPVKLSQVQIEQLADVANRVWADVNHEDLCACTDWPESCVNGHYLDEWRSGSLEVGMPAVIEAWEAMRALAEADELSRLRARVAELEALTPAAIQTCRTCGAGYALGQPCGTCAFQAEMAAALANLPEGPRG
ncbi:hypothetical protein PL81_38820 [Streptomyces sp. RSD-27]|nr:hypothetical protein PL81_38820 [Streptomyces sp. RSD-27]